MKMIKAILEILWALFGLLIGHCPKNPPDKCPFDPSKTN